MSTQESTKTQAQEIASALRQIAVEPLDVPRISAYMSLQVPGAETDDERIATVDAVGMAVLGKQGEARAMSDRTWHHNVHGRVGQGVMFGVFDAIASPEERARVAELAELRAKVAELEGTQVVKAILSPDSPSLPAEVSPDRLVTS